MRKFPSVKAERMLRILMNNPLNYFKRNRKSGSHHYLVAPGREPILFYFHKSAEINGRIVKEMLVDKAGLSEEEAWKLLH
jgi:predicted RNA binding protein YcfA (HicA-like mRNA interferase family)